ncbi:MAG: caspase family protein, partial [Alphaproteobacteria bacterium]|nr:caspase family protein [Alphaproteobacteria bacterium]
MGRRQRRRARTATQGHGNRSPLLFLPTQAADKPSDSAIIMDGGACGGAMPTGRAIAGRTGARALRAARLVLSALLLLYASAAAAANPDAVAVIIGNKTYRDRVPAVEFAHNDAAAIKRFVVERLGYRDGNVIEVRDATLGDLRRVFGSEASPRGQLANWVKPGRSDVVVFYSGHGVPGLQDRRGYLLPVDGDANLAESTGYAIDLLYANLARIEARAVTVFLDACFSGDSPKGLIVRATSGLSVTPRLPGGGGRVAVLAAGGGDQVASWDEQAR